MSGRHACAIALLTALAGCRAADPSMYPPRAGEPRSDLIVLDNHWHTAMIFQSADLPEAFRPQLGGLSQSQYVMLGWGDEGFFRAEHITPGLIAQALFYSRGSVMLAVGLDDEPEAMFDNAVDIYRIPTTPQSLKAAINASMRGFRTESQNIADAGPGIDGGRFFTGTGRYAFYHTCNNWTADVLAEAGLPISAAYAQTAGNLAFQLRQLPHLKKNGLPVLMARQPDASTLLLARGRRP